MKTKSILTIFLIITIIFSSNITLARIGTTGVSLYSKNSYTGLIKYNGEDIELEYVVYKYNGKEYPAYSKDYNLPGITIENSYKVDVVDQIYDMNLWRIVTNGYPYKSYQQLGCNNPEEAYLATKLAIYNYAYNYKIEEFETSNQMGQTIIETMQNIINLAQNSNATKNPPYVQILSGTDYEWNWDNETDCLYKIYKVESEYPIDIKTKLILQGDVPEGVTISNINNEIKEEFEYGEDIKLSIPRINLIKSGNFNIEFVFKCKTLPVYYAIPNTANYSGYILADDGMEQISIIKEEEYNKHAEKVEIDVKAAKTGKPLTNVEFELLDQDEKCINTYKTDENGEIVIKALPGDYYLKQTKVDEQYSMLDEIIPLEIRLNKEFEIHFMLNKKEEIVIETEDKNIIVSEIEKIVDINSESIYINIKDLLGCPLKDQEDTSQDNSQDTSQDSSQDTSQDILPDDSATTAPENVQNEDKKEQITEIIKETENVKKLPRTGM